MNTKICKCCGKSLSIYEFSLRGEFDKHTGEPKRRKVCNSCRNSERRKKTEEHNIEVNNTVDNYSEALIQLARHNPDRLLCITKKSFCEKTNAPESIEFTKIVSKALSKLTDMGLYNEASIVMDEGNYLVVGDSFGKHTKTKMFDLLKNVVHHKNIHKIIHLGNIMDDDGDVSNLWKQFSDKLIVVAKPEELSTLHELNKNNNFTIVRKSVQIGDVTCKNQELISPYVKTPLTAIDQSVTPTRTIVNCTRHELHSRSSYESDAFIASPGTLAEPFVRRVVKVANFTDGTKMKLAYSNSFSSYRRKDDMTDFWEKGMTLVRFARGTVYTTMHKVEEVEDEYVAFFDDSVITNQTCIKPDSSSIIIADTHVPYMCDSALAVVGRISNLTKFDNCVILGDIIDNRSVNHHEMSRGFVSEADYLEEYKMYHRLVSGLIYIADNIHVMFGNHDNFMTSFTKKMPQFKNFFRAIIEAPLKKHHIKYYEDKEVVECDGVKYLHGDHKMFGTAGGTNLEKMARVFGSPTVSGHSHCACIRFGSYSIPALCNLSQGYNEPNASRWSLGCAVVGTYKGQSFIQIVPFKLKDGEVSTIFSSHHIECLADYSSDKQITLEI